MSDRDQAKGWQRGSAAVEFALIAPFLFALVLGGIDWGYYFFCEQVVVNASREGARAGTLHPMDDSGAYSDALTTTLNYLDYATLASSTATVNVAVSAASVSVVVQYPVGSITGFLGGPPLVPAAANTFAVMRR